MDKDLSSTANEENIKINSLRKPKQVEDIGVVTEEMKLRAMLGYKDENPGLNPMLREEFCGACGFQHPNYLLLDIYSTCLNCLNCLREHSHLRRRYAGIPQETPLEILFATYGDLVDPICAIDVTSRVKELVGEYIKKDRLAFRETQKLDVIFGCDPAPDKPKQLRIRYRMLGRHAMMCLDAMPNNKFPEPVLLMCPTLRMLTILRAAYGHPKGRTPTGRMSVDVVENIQGLVDLNQGSYLYISAMTPVTRLFGDPCPGYLKDLQIEFDISGREGYLDVGENRGILKREIKIETAPCVSPLIFVATAYYGISTTALAARQQELEKRLGKISILEHRKSIGLPITAADRLLITKKDIFRRELEEVAASTPSCLDVTSKVQRIVEKQGGFEVFLDKETFDPNIVFGNPIKNKRKYLEISLQCIGHDSEVRTDSKEVTTKGYLRNFILGKKSRFLIPVEDDETGKGHLEFDLRFETDHVLPLMLINKAMYGHPHDNSKSFDVTSTVQNMVKGRFLIIPKSINLGKIFGDPCPGVSKILRVSYVTRGFTGSIRVRERNDLLVAAVELGFVPVPLPDT